MRALSVCFLFTKTFMIADYLRKILRANSLTPPPPPKKKEEKFILARPWLPWPVQFKAVLVRMSLIMRIRGKVQNKPDKPFPAGCGPAPVLWWAWKSVGFLLFVITTITPAPLTRQPEETFPAMCDEEVDRLRVCIRDNLVSEAVDS